MNRIMEMITSGRATDKIIQVLISTIPAFVVGAILLAGYCLAMQNFRKKNDLEKAAKLRSNAPWFYFIFVVVLWLTHNGVLPARRVDFSFALTPAHLFYFVTDVGVFTIQGYLFGRIKEKPVASLAFCVAAIVVLELVQYFCRFGVLSAVHFTAMVLGSAIGIAMGHTARKKAEKKSAYQAA